MSANSRKRMEAFANGETEVKAAASLPEEEPAREEPQPEEADREAPIVAASRTDIGRVRKINQDALIVSEPLFGVADGMGGHKGGEVASSGLRDLLIAELEGKEPDPEVLLTAVKRANRRLFIRSQEDEELRGMGTTLDVLWLGAEKAYIAHVGDSRVYLLREGALRQVTDDHSMVMEMVRAGLITAEQAAVHPMRNIITRAVGTENSLDVDILTEDRRAGDIWLLCTDGLHGLVEDEALRDRLTRYAPEQAADELLSMALEAGGHDNVSFVILLDREGA